METFDPSVLDVTWDEEYDKNTDTAAETARPQTTRQKPFNQAILVAVDCHDAGTGGIKDIKSLFSALEVFVRFRIRAKERDKIGVVLYGCDSESNDYSIKGLTQVAELKAPTADTVKTLKTMSNSTLDEFMQKFHTCKDTRNEAIPLSNLLRYALRDFRIRAPASKFSRRFVLLTSRDDPCYTLKQDATVSYQLSQDLLRNGCLIDVIPLAELNWDKFWLRIVQESHLLKQKQDTEDPDLELDPESMKSFLAETYAASSSSSPGAVPSLLSILTRGVSRQRTFQKTLLMIGSQDVKIGVNVFLVLVPQKKPAGVKLRAQDHKPVKTNTQWLSNAGENMSRRELESYYEIIGGKRFVFTKSESHMVRGSLNAEDDAATEIDKRCRMKLEGFFPSHDYDRFAYNYKDSVMFIYGSEELVEGSKDTLSALIEAMVVENVYCLIQWKFRVESVPRYYCGVPSWTDTGSSIPGLYLIGIPYYDDLRTPHLHHPPEGEVIVDESAEELWSKVLDKSSANLDLSSIENPAILKLWHGLETMVYEEEEATEASFQDPTLEPLKAQRNDELLNACGELGRSLHLEKRGVKRGKKETSAAAAAPKRRIDTNNSGRADLSEMTVVQLKKKLQEYGLKVSGNKSELIERIDIYEKGRN